MEKLPMCRVCLAKNVRMYEVVNTNLRELYEKLTGKPFITQDSRPILICFFCCTKLKQCYQFQRKCLEAEELFAQMLNEDYEPNPLINQVHPVFCNGFIQSPIELISIVGACDTENIAIKVEIEPKEEHESYELQVEKQENSFSDVEDILAQSHSESNSEDDVPLMELKTEVEEQEVWRKTRRASDIQDVDQNHDHKNSRKRKHDDHTYARPPELDNVDKSYPNVEDTPEFHAKSDSEDVPLMGVKIKLEDEQESTGAPVAKKPKLGTRRLTPRETISAEQKKNGFNRKLSSVSEISMKSQNNTSNQMTKFKNPFTKIHHTVSGSINKTDLSTSFRNNSNRDNIKCKISNKGIDSDKIKRYRRVCVNETRLECEICQRTFNTKSHLITHTRTHAVEKPFKCDICQRSFIQKNSLVNHSRTHTGEKPFKCDICLRSFNEKGNLVSHIRTHTGEKPFKCDICQRSFNQKKSLISHNRIHSGEKPFNCDICQRSFKDKCGLASHTRTHTGKKPFNCNICQRSFSVKNNLVIHTRTHTGEKPFKCDICQRSFNHKCTLAVHSRRHTGEKPFKCDICQRSFNEKGNLVRHIRIHNGEKPFKCVICQRSFTEKRNLVSHIRIHSRYESRAGAPPPPWALYRAGAPLPE